MSPHTAVPDDARSAGTDKPSKTPDCPGIPKPLTQTGFDIRGSGWKRCRSLSSSVITVVSAASPETDEWRSIILFGRNVATYKFALGKSLIELGWQGREAVSLEELAVPFASHLCDHLNEVDTQGAFERSRFLDASRFYNAGEIDHDELTTATAVLGFGNVIEAFHRLRDADASTRFLVGEREPQREVAP